MVARSWTFKGAPLLLKEWASEFSHEEGKQTKAPVWIKLPCLNIQLWTKKGLSKIASALGSPLSTDGLTDRRGMLNYARILVEVDLTKPIKQCLKCKLLDGSFYKQQLLYEWMPTQCEKCSLWGHKMEICPKDKPQNGVVMEANIEPLQRGLLPTACFKVTEDKAAESSNTQPITEVVQRQSGEACEREILSQPVLAEQDEGLTKKQKRKKKKSANAKASGEISQEIQNVDMTKMATTGDDVLIQKQNQNQVEEPKPPDLGGK